jgi:SAM-dependent methyltransferase
VVQADAPDGAYIGSGDGTVTGERVRVLGDSFHPGGAALTERFGRVLGLAPGRVVLDAACGTGTSAILIAQTFACSVVGIDLSAQQVDRAAEEVNRLGLGTPHPLRNGRRRTAPGRGCISRRGHL